jgi:hypothetical protein
MDNAETLTTRMDNPETLTTRMNNPETLTTLGAPDTGQRLQKTKGVIKNGQSRDTDNNNGQSRDTGNTGYTKHRTNKG